VQHPGPVRRAQRPEHAEPDVGGAHRVDRPVADQDVVQRPRRHELHDDPRPPVGLEHVVDPHHVGVVQPGRGPRLAQRPAAHLVALGRQQMLGRDDLLDGHVAPQRLVPGVPDPPHTTYAQRLDEAIAAGNEGRRSGHRDEITHPSSE